MSDCNISVLHFADRDDEAMLSTQQQVVQQLSAGRDVVLVCEEDVTRRMERMTLASLAFRSQQGRFAIVATNSEHFADMIPPVMAERLHVFSTQDDAISWLRPGDVSMKETLRYFSLN